MDDPIVVCRLADETPEKMGVDLNESTCSECKRNVLVEPGCEGIMMCIHCAAVKAPTKTIFVELPPDEWGQKSIAASIAQVLQKDGGEWHKHGMWHDQQWALNNVE